MKPSMLLLFGPLVLFGCSGMGVVASSDPGTKISDAENLFREQNRPLIAERLIREAMDIYQQRGDSLGLGHSYSMYAQLLRSSSVLSWEKYYRENGFQDESVTFDNRLEKASDYLRKSLEYYRQAEKELRKTEKFDSLTNAYLSMGWSYWMLKDLRNACRAFDQSLEAYAENIRRNPGANVQKPSEFETFDKAVVFWKKDIGCK